MENNNKIILHIVFDGILFDGITPHFDKMDGYENIYILNVYGEVPSFKYIKDSAKVIIAKDEKEWGSIISNPNIDIIYFHGLWTESARAIRYISDDVVVVWWCYGMEIYENVLGISPLLPINIYKSHTLFLLQKWNLKIHRFTSNFLAYFFPKVYNFIMRIKYPEKTRTIYSMLGRVDYLFTPLPLEYEEVIRYNKFIKAKPFRLYFCQSPDEQPVQHSTPGEILFDHSAVLSNNHADIFHALKRINISKRTLNIPISYGDEIIREKIKKYSGFNGACTNFIENPIPYIDYKAMIRKCSHAFFGGIRQTGLGNIHLCLRNGVKIYFFKDSITYKYLKRAGYIVYSIEDNLSDDEIKTPLDANAVTHNFNLFYKIHGVSHGSYEQQFDRLLEDSKKTKLNN